MTVPAGIDEFVDVFAVTGFLGAGKTTLIKALLDCEAAPGTAVLVSEFGEIGLDDAILADAGDNMVQLQNGCICCRVGGSLEQALRDMFVARLRGHVAPFRRLFIETSGMSDPVDLVATLNARPVREMRYRMRGTVVAFDSEFGADNLRFSREAGAQLAAADCIVLTKSDRAAASGMADVAAACSPGAPVLRGVMGRGEGGRPVLELAAAALASTPAASVFRAACATAAPDGVRHAGIRSASIVLDGLLDWPTVAAKVAELAAGNGAALLRFKAILSVDGIDAPVVAHGVRGTLYPPTTLTSWPFPRGESRIVLIYATDEPDLFGKAAEQALAGAIVPGREKMRAA